MDTLKIQPYDCESESFADYLDRVENFFDLGGIKEDDKKAKLFLHYLDPKSFKLMKTLCAPDRPTTKKYPDLVDLLKKHIEPQPNELAEQHKFLNTFQEEGESIQDFATKLRNLTINCNYNCPHCQKSTAETHLKAQFIRGLNDVDIRTCLLQKKGQITFKDIVDSAVTMQSAKLDSKLIGRENFTNLNKISKTKWKKPFDVDKEKQGFSTRCYRCGDTRHLANDCKFIGAVCHKCNKRGHLAKVCSTSGMGQHGEQRKTHQLEDTERDSSSDEIYNLRNSKRGNREKIMLRLRIEGKLTDMELDTGAAVSTMSLIDFKRIVPKAEIRKTSLLLKTYTGEIVSPMGAADVSVQYKNQNFMGVLYLLDKKVDPIFGREWLRAVSLDWREIKSVSINHKFDLNELFEKYTDVFTDNLGKIENFKASLELVEDSKPIFVPPRNIPYSLVGKVEKELDKLEKEGIISKVSYAQWGSPIVPVPKPSGEVRVCADYSVTINKYLKDEKFPIPKVDEILAKLKGGKLFCTLDIQKAYLQMEMDETSSMLQAISTSKGVYKVNRLMFGIKNAPAKWNCFMYQMLYDLEGVSYFFDDIKVQGKDYEELYCRLCAVLDKLQQYGVTLNKEKCIFFQRSINFLGFIIDDQGIRPSQKNLTAILEASQPTNLSELRTFLGLINYYHRFVPNMATIINPLNQLTRKNQRWIWSKDCQDSFSEVKRILASDKVLMTYDSDLPLVLATDASPVGLGAVLSHKLSDGSERPIAYASRTLTRTEARYSQIDKEATAIYWGVRRFFQYCYGRKFTLVTDHKPLVTIFHPNKALPTLAATRMFHYSHFLSGFDYDIVYRECKFHGNADYFSRFPLQINDTERENCVSTLQLQLINEVPITRKSIAQETLKDNELNLILAKLKEGTVQQLGLDPAEYTLEGDVIFRGNLIVIPKALRSKVLEELHAAHIGITRMKNLARKHCWWKGMNSDIENMVKGCKICREAQKNPTKCEPHPWLPPEQPWQRVHVDFAGPVGGVYYFLVVDAYSKWLEVEMTDKMTSSWVIRTLRQIFTRNGMPNVVVSDNQSCFTSSEFQHFLQHNCVFQKRIAPYHPQSNGQVERYVQTLKKSLKCLAMEQGDRHMKLCKFLIQYRRTPHTETGTSPYEMFFNRQMRTRLTVLGEKLYNTNEENNVLKHREFKEGDNVQVRFYGVRDSKWRFGNIVKKEGNVHYHINVGGEIVKRHVDQIRKVMLNVNEDQIKPPNLLLCHEDKIHKSNNIQDGKLYGEGTKETQASVEQPGGENGILCPENNNDSSSTGSDNGDWKTVVPQRKSQRQKRPPKKLSY